VAVVDTKETTLTMTARRGMIGVAAVEEVDAVDTVAVEEEDIKAIGPAITLTTTARDELVMDVVWKGWDD